MMFSDQTNSDVQKKGEHKQEKKKRTHTSKDFMIKFQIRFE